MCFINGSYSKSRGGGVRRGWGRRGLEKLPIAGQTGSLPVIYANDYRSLAVLGRGLVARISAELDPLSFPVRSSLSCALGNTEMSPGHPLLIPSSHHTLSPILPEQSKSLVYSTLSLVKLSRLSLLCACAVHCARLTCFSWLQCSSLYLYRLAHLLKKPCL